MTMVAVDISLELHAWAEMSILGVRGAGLCADRGVISIVHSLSILGESMDRSTRQEINIAGCDVACMSWNDRIWGQIDTYSGLEKSIIGLFGYFFFWLLPTHHGQAIGKIGSTNRALLSNLDSELCPKYTQTTNSRGMSAAAVEVDFSKSDGFRV